MIINLPPILGPELLFTLRAVGHGVVPLRDATLAVLPVDDIVPQALFRAMVKGSFEARDPVHAETEAVCRRRAPGHALAALPGDAFHSRVQAAYTVVATSEPRLYGNIVIRKGVIHPGGEGDA